MIWVFALAVNTGMTGSTSVVGVETGSAVGVETGSAAVGVEVEIGRMDGIETGSGARVEKGSIVGI